MNNQVVLSALKTALTSKTEELEKYRIEVYNPEMDRIKDLIFKWFKENIDENIPGIKADSNSININSYGSRWENIRLSVNDYWNKDESKHKLRLSKSSSSMNSGEDNDIADLIIAGKVAQSFYAIEHMLIKVWNPMFREIESAYYKFQSEVDDIERGIRQIEYDQRDADKARYKMKGFSCKINTKKDIIRDWDADTVELVDLDHSIKLQWGRSRYEYVFLTSFKIKDINKYKCTLEYTIREYPDAIKEVTMTIKKLDEFIDTVYEWQNGGSIAQNKREEERYQKLTEQISK